ncbi:alpha/beta fold hydrolase [Rhodobacterales bacterium HKCCE3408]|nr:alpha/beta fold hydrolase [Rhodobacterales bacterium HKCCE3408]
MKFRFSDCELDTRLLIFLKSGRPVTLEPQVLRMLTLFLERAGEVVSRDELVDTVWDGRIVSDSTISTRINAVRRAIGDNDRNRRLVETLSKRGYRFAADVDREADGHPGRLGGQDRRDQVVRVARSADGTMIAHATTGQGPPLLRAGQFLTHLNMDWESGVRRPLLDRMGASFSLTRFDQRGTGLSGSPQTDFSLDRLVQDMLAVADDAGLDQFAVWASSQGVPVSLAFAARYPERVSRMVLYGGFAQGRATRSRSDERMQSDTLLDLIAEGWGNPEGAFAKAYATLFMPDATATQLEDMCRMQLASATPEVAIALRRSLDTIDVSGVLRKIEMPVLVIHATRDSINPLEQSRMIASSLPNARLKVIDSRNHVPLPNTDAFEDIVKASIDFLTSAPSA